MSIPRALERMREVVGKTFSATADVLRKSQVADTSGGATDSYTLVATYPCSFSASQVRPREAEAANRIQLIEQWSFVFPASAIIRPTDRLRVGPRTFEVVSSGVGSIDIVLRVICTEIQ